MTVEYYPLHGVMLEETKGNIDSFISNFNNKN